ncbi:MAG: 23S rRNA (adenine(2503)-C(2))-methyltransferase RlmN [Gemmatimonadota bacterium]
MPTTSRRSGTEELLGLSPDALSEELNGFFARLGEPRYRSDQVERAIYGAGVRRFDEISTLPAALREELAGSYSLTPLEPAFEARSRDGTVKHLWKLSDGEQIESVLIPTRERLTLCLSSQSGCALGCLFCATGYLGLRRQLRSAEIVAQYAHSARFARSEWDRKITNVVYMGMGEPLANPGAVFASLDILHRGFGLGARRLTVSTVGLVPGILELARRPEPFELAVSLHAPVHELRARLMPIEKRYPLPALVEALRTYQRHKRRRVSLEYTLIEGINDLPELAESLAGLLDGLLCFVNLIPFNPIPDRPDWVPSPPHRVAAFARALERHGVAAAVRRPRGRDIAAACGQLRLARLAAGSTEAAGAERGGPSTGL